MSWILVTERLPPVDVPVITSGPGEIGVTVTQWSGDSWYTEEYGDIQRQFWPVAWQPMPEQYVGVPV